ncbi:hypothetical protein [Mumia zhuanghuii]|uniref:hypothetical protein n=1 Tax=Mumia zhuanghuii TaxID=2585211 RepID=UPI00363D2849
MARGRVRGAAPEAARRRVPHARVARRGAAAVSSQAVTISRLLPFVHHVLVNGAAGVVGVPCREAQVVIAFTVTDGKIVAIDVLSDPERLACLDLSGVLD